MYSACMQEEERGPQQDDGVANSPSSSTEQFAGADVCSQEPPSPNANILDTAEGKRADADVLMRQCPYEAVASWSRISAPPPAQFATAVTEVQQEQGGGSAPT